MKIAAVKKVVFKNDWFFLKRCNYIYFLIVLIFTLKQLKTQYVLTEIEQIHLVLMHIGWNPVALCNKGATILDLLWFDLDPALSLKLQSVLTQGLQIDSGFPFSYWMWCESHSSPQPLFFISFLQSHLSWSFVPLVPALVILFIIHCKIIFSFKASDYYISPKNL